MSEKVLRTYHCQEFWLGFSWFRGKTPTNAVYGLTLLYVDCAMPWSCALSTQVYLFQIGYLGDMQLLGYDCNDWWTSCSRIGTNRQPAPKLPGPPLQDGKSLQLTIGYHQLEGKRVALKKPLAILSKCQMESTGESYEVCAMLMVMLGLLGQLHNKRRQSGHLASISGGRRHSQSIPL